MKKDLANRMRFLGSRSFIFGAMVVVLGALLALTSFAEEAPLVTDRPDVTEGPNIVQPGRFQIEGGFLFERETDGPNVNTFTFPQLLMRIGLTRNIEFRIGGDGFVYLDEEGTKNRANGSDLVLQAKFHLSSQTGYLPETAGLVGLSLPTGGRDVTSDGVDPSVAFIWSYALPGNFALEGNIGFAVPTNGAESSGRFFEAKTTITLGIPLTDRLRAFVEYFGSVATRGEKDPHAFDGGFTYLVTENFQLDLWGSIGLTEAAANSFFGFGAAWRY
jgi:hypothetical protein